MKRFAKRVMACVMAAGLFVTCAGAETTDNLDYTVEQKLIKQLEAGSGFQGTLTVEADAVAGRESDAFTTLKPLTFDVSYIYVRPDAATNVTAENRMTLAFTDGEKSLGTAGFSLSGGLLAMTSSLLGDGWYTLDTQAETTAVNGAQAAGAIGGAAKNLVNQASLPGLTAFALKLANRVIGTDTAKLSELLEPYSTKVDLWLEGYRQDAVLDKTEDGTATMKVDYSIPATAVKAQLKQMVMDLLADEPMLQALKALLPEEDISQFLDPAQQNYYFYTVDMLPIDSDLIISRTVSLKGDTLALSLALPLYDSRGGKATIRYDRSRGKGDVPDENTLELQTDTRLLRLKYQTYSTLTGTTVYQGTLLREPQGTETYEVDSQSGAETGAKTFSTAFTLTSEKKLGTDESGKDTVTRHIEFSLTPEYTPENDQDETASPTADQQAEYVVFPPVDVLADSVFTSGQAKNASTEANITVTVSSEQLPEVLKMTLNGKTKSKWTLDPVDTANAISLDNMDESTLQALLAQAGVKGGLLFLPYVGLPTAQNATVSTDASTAPDATVSPEGSAAPDAAATPITAAPTNVPTLAAPTDATATPDPVALTDTPSVSPTT